MIRRPLAAAVLALALLPSPPAGGQGIQPDIVLSKEVFQSPTLGDHIRMTHTVARGDSLWRTLTKVYGWEQAKVPEAIRQVMELNPKIKNPDLIYPKQKLVVPVPVPEIPPPPPPPPAATPAPAAPTATPSPVPSATPTPTPLPRVEIRIGLPSRDTVLPAGHAGIVEAIGALFTALGRKVQTSGDLVVPIPSGGTVTVDAAYYPVITTGEGRRLLVDLIGGIGGRNLQLLTDHWREGEVLSFGPDTPPRQVIDRLLEASRFARFLRKEEITCGRKATLTMAPDWQVLAEGDDLLAGGTVVLVSWIEPGDSPLPAEWGRFLTRFGFTLVEIGPGATADAKPPVSPDPVAFDLTGMAVPEAVESLARGLGMTTRRKLAIRVSDQAGLPSPPVVIDLTVTRGPNLHLVDFGHLRPEEVGLLSSYRNRLLVISPSELPTHWIPRLAGTVGLRCRKVNSYFTEGGNGRAMLKIPTMQIEDERGLIVFTDGELHPDLLYYLRRQGGRIGIH